ncbi:MAG: hypothetical protein PHW84_01970 [Methanosarcina sp.]|nr:hypothetical protein [Methanosarcina sp.]
MQLVGERSMNYRRHVAACIITAILISIFGLKDSRLTIGPLNNLYIGNLDDFWIGIVPYTLVITCDLDSPKSFVTKLWGPLKVIWKPFVEFGHREVLHHWAWGPVVLVGWWLIPALWMGINVSEITLAGAVLMLWCHIVCDKVYSFYKKVKKVF